MNIKKLNSAISIIALVCLTASGFFTAPLSASAAAQSSLKDVMSTQAVNTTAKHTITWTMATGSSFAAADRISVDFVDADFTLNAIGSWQTTDFTFNDGTSRTIQAVSTVSGSDPACSSGVNNVCVNINTSTNTFVIFAATSYTTSSTGAAVTFTIDGTSTAGTGLMTNKSSAVNSSLITLTDSGSNTDSTKGAVVVATNDVVTVTATVNPTLTLAISSATVALGVITTAGPSTGSHTAQIATNASGGFLLTYNGPTLTSGSNTIAADGSQATPANTTAGFGINLVSNATPVVGAAVTQNAGTCQTLPADYGTANKFSYVASTTTSLTAQSVPADCTYTVSYVADISSVTPSGAYTAAIIYIASGTF